MRHVGGELGADLLVFELFGDVEHENDHTDHIFSAADRAVIQLIGLVAGLVGERTVLVLECGGKLGGKIRIVAGERQKRGVFDRIGIVDVQNACCAAVERKNVAVAVKHRKTFIHGVAHCLQAQLLPLDALGLMLDLAALVGDL